MNRLFVGIVFLLSFKHNTFDVTYKDKDKNRGIRLIGENALLPKRIVFPSGKYMRMFWLIHADVLVETCGCFSCFVGMFHDTVTEDDCL